MVFFHGGAFVSGGGLLDWYDGSALAAEANVVVVSVNYRLGVFGYLCLDGISEGNLGLLDQVESLRWVRENIADYGGDPTNVTVFGQSAGAVSIRLLMEMPEARGLFVKAILQSGPGSELARTRESAESVGRAFLGTLGDDPRNAAVDALLRAQREVSAVLAHDHATVAPAFYPASGTESLPTLDADFSANVRGLAVLCGWNADDASAFVGPDDDVVVATHQMVAQPVGELARRLALAGASARTYRLDWRPAGSAYGATHCVELPLLLGSRRSWEPCPMLGHTSWADVAKLGRELRRIWGRFAHTGGVDIKNSEALPVVWDPELVGMPNFVPT